MELANILDKKFELKDIPYLLDPELIQSPEEQFNMMGYLTVPVIGRYGGAGYQLNQTIFVLTLPCEILQNKCYYRNQQIHLPESVIDKLLNIDELIKHNRPPKKQKLNKQEEEEKKNSPEFHPQTFKPRTNFTFRFMISVNCIPKAQQFMNYVCHNYIFRNLDFSETKRHVAYVPICLIPGTDSGTTEWKKDYKSISQNKLRSEYISFHMKKGSPAYSPNNMKIGIQKKPKFLNLYTVLLSQLQYCVNYHWHFMEEGQTIIQILKMSNSLRDLISQYLSFKGEDGAIQDLIKIFSNQ